MKTYCTAVSLSFHHLQSFRLTQRYESAGVDMRPPPQHLPDLIKTSVTLTANDVQYARCARAGLHYRLRDAAHHGK